VVILRAPVTSPRAGSPAGWTLLEIEEPRFCLAIHPEDRAAFRRGLPRLRDEITRLRPELLVLIPFRRIPTHGHRRSGGIHSFGLADLDARGLCERYSGAPPERWAYEACRQALRDPERSEAARLLVRELPPSRWFDRLRTLWGASGHARDELPPKPARDEAAVVVIPHAGPLAPLGSLLALLERARPPLLRVAVGFDEPVGTAHRELVARFAEFDFWAAEPHGGGPYVIREFLARRAREPWIVFQDSDDVPCVDRLDTLLAAAAAGGADVLGSWELQVNERRGRLTAVRFPRHASAAIRRTGETAQLHPTTIARASALRRSGGLSTAHRFAADREWQLRACFDLDLRNLDRVLYVRSRREGTLSTDSESGMASTARGSLRERWDQAFRDVRDGRRALSAGGLGPEHPAVPVVFTDLRSGERASVHFDETTSAAGYQ